MGKSKIVKIELVWFFTIIFYWLLNFPVLAQEAQSYNPKYERLKAVYDRLNQQQAAGAWKIKITDAPTEAGVEIGDTTIAVNAKLLLYAGYWDENGNYKGSSLVNWFWADTTTRNQAKEDSTTFLGIGTMLEFQPTILDTGYIFVKSFFSAQGDSTGYITIVPGKVSKLIIRDAPHNEGQPVGDITMTTDEEIQLFAAGYDSFDYYLGDQVVNWYTRGLIPEMKLKDSVFVFSPTKTSTGKIYAYKEPDSEGHAELAPVGDSTGVVKVEAGVPTGEIALTAEPPTIPADGRSTSKITSGIIYDAEGNVVTTGTLITVATDLGTITTRDVSSAIPGIQVKTGISGTITFDLQSARKPGLANVTAVSVYGEAKGSASVKFGGEELVLVATRATRTEISQGQSELSVTYEVQNRGSIAAEVISATLEFFAPDGRLLTTDYQIQRIDTVTRIPGGRSREFKFVVNASLTADTVLVTIDGKLTTQEGVYTNFQEKHKWQVQTPPQLNIDVIETLVSEVFKGQEGIPVSMLVSNHGMATANSIEPALRFALGGQDVSNEYVVTFSENNPTTIEGHRQVKLTLEVKVQPYATTGVVSIDGKITAKDVNTGLVCADEGANKPASWIVVSSAGSGILFKSIRTSQPAATSNQTQRWTTKITVENKSGMELSLDSVRVDFIIEPKNVTGEYQLTYPNAFLGSRNRILKNNEQDSLEIITNRTGATTGFLDITGRIYLQAVQVSYSVADTSSRGLGHILIQQPAELKLFKPQPGRWTVNSGQEKDWSVVLTLENSGGSDIELILGADHSNVYFSSGSDFKIIQPQGLETGGTILPGQKKGKLIFTIDETGKAFGPSTINAFVKARELNTDREIFKNTAPDSGVTITIQTPAQLRINSLTIRSESAPNLPYVNQGQPLELPVKIANIGQENAQDVTVKANSDGHSLPGSQQTLSVLPGGSEQEMVFAVTVAADFQGNERFAATIVSAIGANINEPAQILSPLDAAEQIIVQKPAALVLEKIIAISGKLETDQIVNVPIKVVLANEGTAAIKFIPDPAIGEIFFTLDGQRQDDYEVESPRSLASGQLELAGGARDTLIYVIRKTGQLSGELMVNFNLAQNAFDKNSNEQLTASGQTRLTVVNAGVVVISSTKIVCPKINAEGNGEVNQDQHYSVEVKVRNIGGEDLRDVTVSLVSSGFSIFKADTFQIIPALPKRQTLSTSFDLVAFAPSWPLKERFAARIDRAIGIISGTPAEIDPPLDSQAEVKIEKPANLQLVLDKSYLEIPAGQSFLVNAFIENAPENAGYDQSGTLTISLPKNYHLSSGTETQPFQQNQKVSWKVQAPQHSAEPQTIMVNISKRPRDENNPFEYARVARDSAKMIVQTLETVLAVNDVSVVEPAGAVDRILSTDQTFEVKAQLLKQKVENIYAQITAPPDFHYLNEATQNLGDSTVAKWQFKAPQTATTAPQKFIVELWGNKENENTRVNSRPDSSLQVDVVKKADLKAAAKIIDPPTAVGGTIAPGMEFIIKGEIVNLGTAATRGNQRLSLELPDQNSFTLLDQRIIDAPGIWKLKTADNIDDQTRLIKIKIHETPKDENTDRTAYVHPDNRTAEILVATEKKAGRSALVVKKIPESEPVSIAPGDSGIMMGLEFTNLALENEEPIHLKGLKFDVEDQDYNLIQPALVILGLRVIHDDVSLGAANNIMANPVEIPFDTPLKLEAQQSSQLFMKVNFHQNLSHSFVINLRDSSYILAESLTDVLIVNEYGQPNGILNLRSKSVVLTEKDLKKSFRNYPNPFGKRGYPKTHFVYYLPRDTRVELKIFTLLGELVWECTYAITQSQAKMGLHQGNELTWDGKNLTGQDVLNGVYVAKIETGYGEWAITKVAVIK